MKLSPFLSPPPFLTHASSASSSLQSLLKSGFSPTLNSIDNLFLHLYRGQKFNFIVYLLHQLDSNRIHIRYRTYSIVSWAFLSLRKFEEAERFINTHISKSSIFPRTRMLDSLIHGFCVERDDPEKALAVLRNCLRSRGAFPSSNTFCSLIHQHVAKGNMASAVEVLEMMADEKVNYPFDNFVCSAIISGFCKIGKPQLALGFFEHALNSGVLKPDLVTYTALATALCRLGKIDEVSELLRSVENEGFELDTVFYNNWIYGHLREGALMSALLQHRKMVEKGINPDIIGYTILIDGFSKEGNMEEAVGLLGKMMKEGIEPNSVTFTAIMNGFCKKGKLEEAFALLERVLEMGIKVDEFMYATLIHGLCRKGNIDGVFSMLEEMEQQGIKPGIFTYNTVIYGLCKMGRVAEADEISKSVSGNVATYSTLLHGYILEENIDGVLETRRRFEEAKIPMNVAMCNVLLKAHLMVGALGEADALYKAMPDMDLIADSVTYLTMIQGYCKAGWIEEALEIFDELRKTSLSSVACYNCIVNALCKKGMLDTATVVFIELCQKGMGLDMCTLQTLMRAIFAREGEEGILSLLYRLGSLNSDVRLAIFNDAIWFLCNRGSSEAAVEVYMVMRSRGLALTSETYNLLLIGLLVNGKHSLARPLMSIPVKEYGMAEPMVGEMISCFLCLKDTDKALAFLRNTRESNSAFTFPPEVLKILVDDGRALDAYSLAVGAEGEFTSMDVVDYSIVIDGLSKEGYMVKALDLCAFAKSKGIALNIIVYNSVIYGLCHQGCFTEAFRLFDSLEKIGLVPSEVTYAILIDNLSKEGFLSDAKKLLDKMVSKGFEPDIRVYNSMIDGCAKFGKIEEALTILSQIKMRGMTPDAFTVSSLIKGYSRKGDIEEGLKVFDEFKENNILADFPGYLYLIKGFFTKGRMEESRSILREMLVSESVLELLNRVEVEAESEPVRSFLVDLCERGSIHQAITILDEISSMFYPAGKGLNFCPKQQFLDKPCEQEAPSRNNLQSLSSGVREEDTPMEDYTGDTDESHLPDFHHLYSVVSSLCSEGKLLQANRFVRTAISGLQK